MLVPATVLGIMVVFFNFEFSFLDLNVVSLFPSEFQISNTPPNKFAGIVEDNFTNEAATILFAVAAIFAGFSKEKDEDEYIAKIRLESLLWATYANYGILIFSTLLFYQYVFIQVMEINLFTLLIVFLVRFNLILLKTRRATI